MRYYNQEELEKVLEAWNTFWKDGSEDSKNYPELTIDDLTNVALAKNKNKIKSSYFSDFKKKYVLHIGDYFDNDTSRKSVSFNESNTEEDSRFPIIIVYVDTNGNPDMAVITEYKTLKENLDNEDMKIIYIDKIKKPVNKELFDEIAKDLDVAYDYSIYE